MIDMLLCVVERHTKKKIRMDVRGHNILQHKNNE